MALGLTFVAVIGIVIFSGRAPTEKPKASAVSAAKPKVAPPPASATAAAAADAGQSGEQSAFDTLPSGAPVPELPATAPKTVSFGVVLFSYQGAQMAAKDAPSKTDALARAKALIPEAQKDFVEAAKKGDRGSAADAGRIPRGVLEPAVEYLLFSLEKGAVHSEPIDTPRGFWVIKRTN
ncbi:MAG TPA: peptidylprolyl isomerase [Polyangiaceae bacterium]|nr:peptidylprolyl isomerase [Polyangiaceae bacterium]